MARMLLILGALVGAAAFSAPAFAAGGSFTDATGDATNGAPDITAASVDESGGTVTFTISTAGVTTLGASHRYEVRIDSDNNAQTGSSGIDQVLVLHGPNQQVSHWRWTGSAFELQPVSGLSATASAPFRLTVATASLGDPAKIAFWLKAMELNTQGRDDAPDHDAYYVTFRAEQQQGETGGTGGTGGSGQPGVPAPPALPSLGGLPSLPQIPAPPSLPGTPSLPQQPNQQGAADPGTTGTTTTTKTSTARSATLVRSRLTVASRRGRDYLTASMSFRLPAGARVTTTCKGTLAGRALKLVARRSGGTVSCSTPIGRKATGAVRVRMTVKVGNRVFARTFRGTLEPA
jgi:hypothetical protein